MCKRSGMRNLLLLCILIITAPENNSYGQSMAINTDGSAANTSAMLDVKSTIKGLLMPRMTSAQRTAVASPANGLEVYDTDLNQFYYWNGTVWVAIANNSNYWTLSGGNIYNNTGTNVGIGTLPRETNWRSTEISVSLAPLPFTPPIPLPGAVILLFLKPVTPIYPSAVTVEV